MKDRPDLEALTAKYAAEFRLGSFDIRVGYVPNLCNASGAFVYGLMQSHKDAGKAWIGIQDPDTWVEDGGLKCTPENIERILIHELIHVRLMNVVAGQATASEIVAEEQAVHALADAFANANQKIREVIGEGLAKAFSEVPPLRRAKVGEIMARAFSRASAPAFVAGRQEKRSMNDDMLKALGLVLFGLMILAEQGEGDVKAKAQQALADFKSVAGDQAEAALRMANAALSDAGGGDGDQRAAGAEPGKQMSEEELAKAFGSGPRNLADAIKASQRAYSEATDDVAKKRHGILEQYKDRIPEACNAYVRHCSLPDLEAFVATLPEKPLPQARKNNQRGFSVGKPQAAAAVDPKDDKGVQAALAAAGKQPKDIANLARTFGVKEPGKIFAALANLTKVEVGTSGQQGE